MPWMINQAELDADQTRILMATLDKSCVVAGCAGSGKSVLALIKAQRVQNERGNNYSVIVYTKALRSFMNEGRNELQLVNPFYYHEEWKWKKDSRGWYMRNENGNRIPNMPHSDYIIVDEIQDFTEEEIKEFIAATDKHFFFFGDTAQSVYQQYKDTMRVEDIRDLVPREELRYWELYKNYRLPIPVAKVVQTVGVNLDPYDAGIYQSNVSIKPRFLSYGTKDEQLNAIYDIINRRSNLGDIAILLPNNECVLEVYNRLLQLGGNYELRYNDNDNRHNSRDTLDFSTHNPKVMTYYSAKGLQFDTVFLPYIENFVGKDANRKALYVAMTRTLRFLYLLYSGNSLPHPLSDIDSELYLTSDIETQITDF